MVNSATMSDSSDRHKPRHIWKKRAASKNDASSSSTPPIRPSKSFVEKILSDCLRPRSLVDGARSLATAATSRSGSKDGSVARHSKKSSVDAKTQTPRRGVVYDYQRLTEERFPTPGRAYDYRAIAKGTARNPLARNPVYDDAQFFNTAEITTPPLGTFQDTTEGAEIVTVDGKSFYSGGYRSIADGNEWLPPQRGGNYRPGDNYRPIASGSKTIFPNQRRGSHSRDHRQATASLEIGNPPRHGEHLPGDHAQILGASQVSTPRRGRRYQPRDYSHMMDTLEMRTAPLDNAYRETAYSHVTEASKLERPRVGGQSHSSYDNHINHTPELRTPRRRIDYGAIDRSHIHPSPTNKTPHQLKNYLPRYDSDTTNPPESRTPHGVKDIRQNQHRDLLSQPSSTSSLSLSLQEEREQALRDYKVTIEYKHLKSHAPGGVYLIPSMDSLRKFHGIIFVRRGPFTNGIFKFRLSLPPKYNDTNMWPSIIFSSRVFNPYVNEATGELDVQSAYPSWDPSRHYLVTVLTYLKKIFYSKNFADAKANPKAKELAETDPQAYKKKVEECVHESQKKVYVNEKGSTARFTEEEVAHRVLRDLLKHHIRNENQVTKQTVLAQIEKARKV